ncbi:hypothetical protein, partial [Micromonospora parastrephiae]|uniref:hypothetical protein n=1 Tax=Micromonospora parastrephiae TaxID=2806101 RepID=UPI001EE3AD08
MVRGAGYPDPGGSCPAYRRCPPSAKTDGRAATVRSLRGGGRRLLGGGLRRLLGGGGGRLL